MKKIYIYVLIAFLVIGVGIGIYYYLDKDSNVLNIDKILDSNNFSVIDEDIDFSEYSDVTIELNNESVSITEGGVYILSGSISDGSVIVNTEDNVKLILNNVNITNNSGPAIIIENAKNTIIELVKDSVNTLSDGSKYSNSEYDGCIYSKDDLVIQGEGKLVINANYHDGIVSNDDLKIVNGIYVINAIDDGIRGKDSVYIVDGTFNINVQGDGIKSTNDTDSDK